MKKNNLIFILAVAALLLVVPLAWWLFLDAPPPPPPPPPPEVVKVVEPTVPEAPEVEVPDTVAVISAKGIVEVRRAGTETWVKLGQGETLSPSDEIRTGPGSEVKLRAADHTLVLVPETNLSVGELTEPLSNFLLGKGMVQAIANGPRKIRFEANGSDVQVSAVKGRFEMASNGKGTVAVASLEGDVEVKARGEAVVLKGGSETLVRTGRAPTAPSPIARDLLLRVKWPSARRTNKKAITFRGQTRPGALVFVEGALVEVDDRGNFSTRVKLEEGRNRVKVSGMGVGGSTQNRKSPVIVVDTKGAKAAFDTRKLWEK